MRLTITIPVEDNDGSDNRSVITLTALDLTRSFGGCTKTEGTGFWTHKGKIHVDDIQVLTVYTEDGSARRHMTLKEEIKDIIEKNISGKCDQLEIFYTIDDVAYSFKNEKTLDKV